MSQESGGAAPRRGFTYQDYAAAYFFLSDEPSFRSKDPLELHIEQDDSDFSYFIRNSDGEIAHYFEVKEKREGELKWNKFKNDVLAEFASIIRDSPRHYDTGVFHTVINTAFARKIARLHNDAKSLRSGQESWPALSTRRERRYDTIRNAVELDDESKFYNLIWGLFGHTIAKSELDSRIENYLRDCSPRKHRKAKQIILNRIHEMDTGVIRRDKIERDIGFDLAPHNDSTSGSSADIGDIQNEVESISNQYSSQSDQVSKVASDQSITQKYVERLSEEDDTVDETVVETHAAQLDEVFEERIELEKRKSELDHSIGRITDTLVDLEDSTSSEEEKDD